MLDLYHAMATDGEDEGNEIVVNGPGAGRFGAGQWLAQVSYAAPPTLSTHTPPLGIMVSEADTVMSFVNLGECQRAHRARVCQEGDAGYASPSDMVEDLGNPCQTAGLTSSLI